MKICSHCERVAMMRCCKHGGYLCGWADCRDLHRWAWSRSGDDSLPPGFGDCELREPRRFNPMQLLLTACGISVAVVATAMAFAHLWRVQ